MSGKNKSDELAKKVTIDGVMYYFMPIDVSIKYHDKIRSGFFVPLNDEKRVRIHLDDEDIRGKLMTYREKGLTNILFAEADYYGFLKAIKRGLTGFFMKDDDLASKTLSTQQLIFLVNKAITYIGLPQEVVVTGEEVNKKILNWVKTVPSINQHFKVFMRENQDELLKNMMVSYVSIALIDALNWTTPQIKEKIVQSCLFGDITMTSRDYMQLIVANGDTKKWTKSIIEHPLDAARIISRIKGAVAREVVRAIEQHHEMPDGTGFPKQLKGLSIDQLSAITIVARHFINKLIESDFSYDNRKDFIDGLMGHFDYPNFAQPCKALYIIMGLAEKETSQEAS